MLIVEFLIYAFAVAATPGPNNILIASITLRTARSHSAWREILGVSTGFAALLVLCAGLSTSFLHEDGLFIRVLAVLGGIYLIYLSWGLWRDPGEIKVEGRNRSRPGYLKMLSLQALNPKAWLMAVGTTALFLPRFGNSWEGFISLLALFTIVNLSSNLLWAVLGGAGGRALRSLAPGALRGVNRFLAILLVVIAVSSAWSILS